MSNDTTAKIARTVTCRHCGEVVPTITMHGRTLQEADRAEHDRVMRLGEITEFRLWLAEDHPRRALSVLRRHAIAQGRDMVGGGR